MQQPMQTKPSCGNFQMPYRILCNGTKHKSPEARSSLALTSSRCTPLHKIRYGIPVAVGISPFRMLKCISGNCLLSLKGAIHDGMGGNETGRPNSVFKRGKCQGFLPADHSDGRYRRNHPTNHPGNLP